MAGKYEYPTEGNIETWTTNPEEWDIWDDIYTEPRYIKTYVFGCLRFRMATDQHSYEYSNGDEYTTFFSLKAWGKDGYK